MHIKARKAVACFGVISLSTLITWLAYEPLKFHYAIWRIESAKTVEQERAALRFAGRVGYVWEADHIHRDRTRQRGIECEDHLTSPLQGNAGRAFRFDSGTAVPACLSGIVR